MRDNIKGYITNLGKYNEGYLIGEWIEFSIDEDELDEVFSRIGISEEPDEDGRYYEEYFFTDWEIPIGGIKLGEYENIEDVNEIAERINSFDDSDLDIIDAFCEEEGVSFDEAADVIEDMNYIIYSANNMADIAEQYCEETGLLNNVEPWIRNFIDFESMGEEMESEGTYFEACINGHDCIVEIIR